MTMAIFPTRIHHSSNLTLKGIAGDGNPPCSYNKKRYIKETGDSIQFIAKSLGPSFQLSRHPTNIHFCTGDAPALAKEKEKAWQAPGRRSTQETLD